MSDLGVQTSLLAYLVPLNPLPPVPLLIPHSCPHPLLPFLFPFPSSWTIPSFPPQLQLCSSSRSRGKWPWPAPSPVQLGRSCYSSWPGWVRARGTGARAGGKSGWEQLLGGGGERSRAYGGHAAREWGGRYRHEGARGGGGGQAAGLPLQHCQIFSSVFFSLAVSPFHYQMSRYGPGQAVAWICL